MSVIRIAALQRLADQIQACVPELRGKVCGGAAEAPHTLSFPNLAIFGVRFRYFPDQAALHCESGPSRATMNVGRVEGTVQLRLGAQTSSRRYELEQKLMENVFWADIERPGVVVFKLPEHHDAVIAFELDTDEWIDEKAFEKKWYSLMTVALQLPALVTKGSIYSLEEVRLALTEDLTTPIVSVPADEIEAVSISESGDITPAAGP